MTAATEANPGLSIDSPGYDASGHQKNVLFHLTNITTDSSVTPNVVYGDFVAIINAATAALYSLASTVTTGSTQNSGDLDTSKYRDLSIDINTTAQAGTTPPLQIFYERKGADGIYYVLWQSAVLTAATNTLSTSIGAGLAYNQSLGATGRLRWVVGGSATPTFTHRLNIQGK